MLVDLRVLEREYLLAVTRALTAELDLGDVLNIIVRAAVELVSGRAGIIALANPNEEKFRVVAVHGIPAPLIEHFAPLLEGLPYHEGAEQEVIDELTSRLKVVAKAADMGLTHALRLPMMIGEQVIGMVYVFRSGGHGFRPHDRHLLTSFADQAAIAVKNAQLYQAVIAEKQRLDAILEQNADGVMILDPQLVITVFNTALSRIMGISARKAIGKKHGAIFEWRSLKTDLDLEAALAEGWPMPGAAALYVEGEVEKHGGGVVSLGITYAPLLDHSGRMINIIANIRDLTRYREQEELTKTFISVISHELKTPVSIIKGYASTLNRPDAKWSREIKTEYLSVIEEEADHLADLIDNLLEASRLQSGTFKLELEDDVLLPQLAQAAARKFSMQTDNHTFLVNFPADFPPVCGDERRLIQVFNNLLSNAIKYSPDGGTIEICGRNHGQYVTVSIRDEGIGIPAHEKDRIFQKFTRLDNALSRKTEGTGLGLFLTKAIIEAHDGCIWFSSNGKNGRGEDAEAMPGTTFTFSLPRN